MKVSMKADYGIRALLDLAEHYGAAPVPSHDIAARQHVPGPFLDQLLMTLRRAGLVRSTRGPRGGHVLGHAPEEMTLGEAIDVLEGQAAQMECFTAPESCEQSFGCSIRTSLMRAEAASRKVLEQTTLADMVRERQQQGVFHGIYHSIPVNEPSA
ncbi:MAG TPA: Rrf2 family transcriptional regulator [Candidatus Angelobacter sp.]|jgi:Rrf2 family protein|nr:Rrf2 family transcriptional regulator [Candidatus Angelobacter sp.]